LAHVNDRADDDNVGVFWDYMSNRWIRDGMAIRPPVSASSMHRELGRIAHSYEIWNLFLDLSGFCSSSTSILRRLPQIALEWPWLQVVWSQSIFFFNKSVVRSVIDLHSLRRVPTKLPL
jgi:hypothetical protein